jgi:hypothetical protein
MKTKPNCFFALIPMAAMAITGAAHAAVIDLSTATGAFLCDTVVIGDGSLSNPDWAGPNSYDPTLSPAGFSALTDGDTGTSWIQVGTYGWTGGYTDIDSNFVPVPVANAGIYFTLASGAAMQTIQLSSADQWSRNPLTMTIEGSNAVGGDLLAGANWTLLYSGTAGMDALTGQYENGNPVAFTNATDYTSYRVLFPTMVYQDGNGANAVQISEIVANTDLIPEPSAFLLGSLGLLALTRRRRD